MVRVIGLLVYPMQDKRRQKKTRQEERRQDKTRQDKRREDKRRQARGEETRQGIQKWRGLRVFFAVEQRVRNCKG